MISIDDFSPSNIKLANLIKKYGLESDTIFFIECLDKKAQEQIKELDKMGFSCQSHTLTHSHLTLIDDEQAKWEIEVSKKIIEDITGKKCEAFCYPRGRYNNKHITMLKDAGYKWARTTKLVYSASPYERAGYHLTYPRNEYNGVDPFEYAKQNANNNMINHFWGHCFEIILYDLWDKMEEFLKWYKNGQ